MIICKIHRAYITYKNGQILNNGGNVNQTSWDNGGCEGGDEEDRRGSAVDSHFVVIGQFRSLQLPTSLKNIWDESGSELRRGSSVYNFGVCSTTEEGFPPQTWTKNRDHQHVSLPERNNSLASLVLSFVSPHVKFFLS